MTDEQKLSCGEILRYYGEEHQQEKAIEEMAELISAIKHKDRSNYVEELADCMVMNEQLFQALRSLPSKSTMASDGAELVFMSPGVTTFGWGVQNSVIPGRIASGFGYSFFC